MTTDQQVMPMAMRRETRRLIEALRDGNVGDTLTDDDLMAVCERDTAPNKPGYAYLMSAIRHVERNYDRVWKRIHGAGYIKCLEPNEVVGVSDDSRKRIGKISRRSVRQLQTIDAVALSDSDRKDLGTRLAYMGTLALFAKKDAVKALDARDVTEPITVRGLLGAIKESTLKA